MFGNELDKIIYECKKGWYYDNSWLHNDLVWSCYSQSPKNTKDYLVILNDQSGETRVIRVTEKGRPYEEIWVGDLKDKKDVVELLEFVEDYKGLHID